MRQPEYSAKKWQDDWEENQRFMDNISAFPQEWWEKEVNNQLKVTKGVYMNGCYGKQYIVYS